MINFLKTQKTKLIATLSTFTFACFVISLCLYIFPLPNKAVAETTILPEGTYMEMTSNEMVWTGSSRGVTATSSGSTGGIMEYYALNFYPVKEPLMLVWHMPKQTTAKLHTTLRRETNIANKQNSDWTDIYFRVVHYHADTGLNEVIYPADGSWYDTSTLPTDENGKFTSYQVNQTVEIAEGDEIKYVFYNETGAYRYAAFYFVAGMTIDGQYFDHGPNYDFDHLDSSKDADVPVLDASKSAIIEYFGIDQGTTKADILTYEYIESFTDRVVKYEPNMFTYMDKLVIDASPITIWNTKNWNWKSKNLSGAKYIGFDVANSSGGAVYVTAEILSKKAGNSDGYGMAWSPAEYSYCYLIDQFGVMSTAQLVREADTRGKVQVPADFNGQVIFPVDEFERSGYRFGTVLDGITSNYDTFIPATSLYRFDYKTYKIDGVTYNDNPTVTFSNLAIYANDLSARGVALTSNRVIGFINAIGNVTVGSNKLIVNARQSYDALSDTDKAKVINYQTLLDAEQEFASLRYNSYVYSDGKDFTGTGGVYFGEEFTASPSTISAWVKVPSTTADNVHVGTVIGNGTKQGSSMVKFESGHNFALKITTNGNPQLTWRVDRSKKAIFTVTNVDVRTDKWMHVAFTRDVENNTLYCYVNGVLAGQETFATAGALGDISMAYRNVMIGSDYNDNVVLSVGETPNFNGSIAHARVYSTMLSDSDIVSDMEGDLLDGLMGSVDFKNGEQGYYSDDVISDAYDAFDGNGWKTATIDDLKADSDEFSIAVLGDTQMNFSKAPKDANGVSVYTDGYDPSGNVFYKNIQWLIANKDALNLEFVMHMGDLTDNLNSTNASTQAKGVRELQLGIDWMSLLSKNGIRWSLVRGNHDGGFNTTLKAKFDEEYSWDEFGALTDGAYESVANTTTDESGNEVTTYTPANMRNVYYTFNALGKDYLIITLDIQPSDAELAWAGEVIASHPTHRVIISTHAYMGKTGAKITEPMTGDGTHMNTGTVIWDKLASQHKNVIMVLCGHSDGVDIVRSESKGVHGNTVYEFMIDESTLEWAGSHQTGVFALMNFSNGGDTINFNYYSPSEGKLFRACNQFTIELNPAEYGTGTRAVYQKDDLAEVELPAISSYAGSDSFTGNYGSIFALSTDSDDACSSIALNANNWNSRSYNYALVAGFDVPVSGIFRFDDTAIIKSHKDNHFYFSAYVIDGQTGMQKRWFPVNETDKATSITKGQQGVKLTGNSLEYYIYPDTSAAKTYYLHNMGSLQVEQGDKVILLIRSKNTSHVKLLANITQLDGTVKSYSLGNALNKGTSGSTTIMKSLFQNGWGNFNEDGTPKNYNGYSVGYMYFVGSGHTTCLPFTNSVKALDEMGNVIYKKVLGNSNEEKTHTYVLPEIAKTGYQHIGYAVDGKLYPVGHEITVTANTTVIAVYAELAMMNAASLRLNEVSGIRFSTFSSMGVEDFELLSASVEFGTLIAREQDITTDGAIDYSLINLDNGAVIKLVSNVQAIIGDYTNFNGGLVEIKESHYDWLIAGRGYMTVTYADGTIKTFYATVTDNARSIKGIATVLLGDVSKIKTNEYCYAVDGGYSKYDADAIEVLKAYAGI